MRYNHHLPELAALVPLLLVQAAIAHSLIRWSSGRARARRAVRVLIALVGLYVIVGVAINFLPAIRGSHSALSAWRTGAFVWIACSGPAFALYVLFRWLSQRIPETTSPGRRRLIQAAGGIAAAAPFGVLAFGAFIERLNFRVQEVDLPIANLHPDLEGLRIIQLSDIHLGSYLKESELARVIDASNELRPHAALMTGDLITTVGDPIDSCLRQLARLRSDAGIFGCLGNHEVSTRTQGYATAQGARMGVEFLRKQNRPLRFGGGVLNLAGVDYQEFYRKAHYLKGAENLLVPGATNVLMSHNPDVFPVAVRQGWDAALGGHTHGGQVTVEILDQTLNAARFYTRFVSGFYRVGTAACYVTRGIGTIGIPVRLGAPPEITLLRLRKA